MTNGTLHPDSTVLRLPKAEPRAGHAEGCSRYGHILVPTRLDLRDRAAILHALDLAAAHGALVTVLHVRAPDEPANSLHWLDAIDRLHQSMTRLSGRTTLGSNGSARSDVELYLELIAPAPLRERVRVDLVSVVGDFATETARFAEPADVDLVVLSLEPSTWGLPLLPGSVRTVLQRSRKQVVLVSPDANDSSVPLSAAAAAHA